MSMHPLEEANYDVCREPLTLGGKAAVLAHLTPRRDPQQTAQAQQAAAQALRTAFRDAQEGGT